MKPNHLKNPSNLTYVILRGMNPVDKETELKYSNLIDKIKYNGNLVYTDDDIIRYHRGGFENYKNDECFLQRGMRSAINQANRILVLNSDDNCTNLAAYEKELIDYTLENNYNAESVLFMDKIPFNADNPGQSYCTTSSYDIYGTLFYKAYSITRPKITIVADERMLEYYKVMFASKYRDSYIDMYSGSDIRYVKHTRCDWVFVFNNTAYPLSEKNEEYLHYLVSEGLTVFYSGIRRRDFPFEISKYYESVYVPEQDSLGSCGMVRKDLYFSQLLLKEKE